MFSDESRTTPCDDVYSSSCPDVDIFEEQSIAMGWSHVCTLGKKVTKIYSVFDSVKLYIHVHVMQYI